MLKRSIDIRIRGEKNSGLIKARSAELQFGARWRGMLDQDGFVKPPKVEDFPICSMLRPPSRKKCRVDHPSTAISEDSDDENQPTLTTSLTKAVSLDAFLHLQIPGCKAESLAAATRNDLLNLCIKGMHNWIRKRSLTLHKRLERRG